MAIRGTQCSHGESGREDINNLGKKWPLSISIFQIVCTLRMEVQIKLNVNLIKSVAIALCFTGIALILHFDGQFTKVLQKYFLTQ